MHENDGKNEEGKKYIAFIAFNYLSREDLSHSFGRGWYLKKKVTINWLKRGRG